ncbi:MAG: 2OG-Fe(II) oxygenase [Akkermansiaceae bacterium]|nr:2OG-Fe(II) oxygenase [Akkermansiaceae bacterium]
MSASGALLEALSSITGSGNFHSAGTAPFFLPGLHVDGIGELAFPLPPSQAEELIALAEAAPYGLGEKTILDEAVRKCWQIDASRFSFKSPQWKKFLDQTVVRIRENLGIQGKISAHPYKLLLYGKGGHFKAHRDTEKLDAMFGTLIIALPSAHEGGGLFIRHAGKEIEVDFSEPEHRHKFQHAAFFADCEHEVVPVRSGYRCCLVYNLRLDSGEPDALNQPPDAQARSLVPVLEQLKRESPGDLAAILLEHGYTEANFSLGNLKGEDTVRARALLAAAGEAGFSALAGLVTYHCCGTLESGGYGYDDDEDVEDGTMGEIIDESLVIEHWRDARDRRVDLGSYHIGEDAIISRQPIGEGEPDEKEAEGYTGNAGCTMDHWYRRAAIVLWAKEDQENILCRYGFRGACAALADLSAGKRHGPGSPFHRLARAVITGLPDHVTHRYHRGMEDAPLALVLRSLAGTRSRDLLDELMSSVPDQTWEICTAPLWRDLHQAFGTDAFATLRDRLAGEPGENRTTLFTILDALASCGESAPPARPIASLLAAFAPKAPNLSYGESTPCPPGNLVETRILLAASHLLDD